MDDNGGRRLAALNPYSAPASLLTLVNGVVVGIGGVYMITLSVMVTAVAATAAVVLAALGLMLHR